MDTSAQQPQSDTKTVQPQPGTTGAMSKEIETSPRSEVPALKEIGQETELPPEVHRAGVKVQPTTIAVPPAVTQMGVQPTGVSGPQPAPSVVLPLTDDQIAQGLKQGITSSWRWLAEWCWRRMKQLHLAIKSIHGNIVRAKP